MKKQVLTLIMALSAALLTGYDLKTQELVPVKFQKAPEHQSFKLVENGKLNFAIVADLKKEQAMRKTNKTQASIAPAVETLKDAFLKCTGITPVVFDAANMDKAKKYPYMIVVGDCGIAKKYGVDTAKLPSQGLVIKTFPKGIIIAGNDSSFIKGYNTHPLDQKGSSLGTSYAALDFAERFMGIRYFFPGEYGTLYPAIKNLEIKPVFYTDAPYFDTRQGSYGLVSLSHGHPRGKKFWEQYLGKLTHKDNAFPARWRMGGTTPSGGTHCPRPERIAKAYPDKLKTIFYTSPAGNFYYNPKDHIGNYFDVTNLEFADLLIDSLKKYYATNGKVDEGAYRTQCCNNTYISFGMCDTLMYDNEVINHPTVEKYNLMTEKDVRRRLTGSGSGGNPGMANIYARFHQHLAKRIKKEFPGKKLYIMAYYNAQYAGNDPRWKLPDNTEVFLCLGDLPNKTRNKKAMDNARQLAKEWYESLGNRPVQKMWLYQGTHPFIVAVAGEFVGDIPKIFGKYLGNTSLYYAHCNGVPGNVWFHYPSAYAVYRSMWSPEWDSAKAIDMHWEKFYGKEAGANLREFHKLVRKCYLEYGVNKEDSQSGVIYPMAQLLKMEEYLAKAAKAVKPGSVEEKRLKVFSAPWPKAIQAMKNQISYERPVHNVYQLLRKEKVTLNGKADEAFWKKAKAMTLMDPLGTGSKLKYPVSIKLAWDKTGIYGLFETSYPAYANPKNGVWYNDNYEVIFSPGLKREVKYQFAFDPLGNQFLTMQRFLPILQPLDRHWKAPGFRHVSTRSKDGKWTVEFYIPFTVFGEIKTPRAYETWHCNIVRNKKGANNEYSGSSMTLGNNHNMNMYGFIKFAGKGE